MNAKEKPKRQEVETQWNRFPGTEGIPTKQRERELGAEGLWEGAALGISPYERKEGRKKSKEQGSSEGGGGR